MSFLNDKMTGHQAVSKHVSGKSDFTWSLLLSSAYQFCFSGVWLLEHHSVHVLDMSTIIVFLCIWVAVQMKPALLKGLSPYQTYCMLGSDPT